MAFGLPPIFPAGTNQCNRCGKPYPRRKDYCPHCHHLSDTELHEQKQRWEDEQGQHHELGRWMLITGVVLGVLTLLALF